MVYVLSFYFLYLPIQIDKIADILTVLIVFCSTFLHYQYTFFDSECSKECIDFTSDFIMVFFSFCVNTQVKFMSNQLDNWTKSVLLLKFYLF